MNVRAYAEQTNVKYDFTILKRTSIGKKQIWHCEGASRLQNCNERCGFKRNHRRLKYLDLYTDFICSDLSIDIMKSEIIHPDEIGMPC